MCLACRGLLDAMQPSAYRIFLLHYVVYDPAWPAVVKSAIVFAATLDGSWLLTVWLRKNPIRGADDLT